MKNNNATDLDVDPQTYEVFVDGEKIQANLLQNSIAISYSRVNRDIEEIVGNIANLSDSEKVNIWKRYT